MREVPWNKDELIALWNAGEHYRVIAEKLQLNECIVAGRIHRLKQWGYLVNGKNALTLPKPKAPEPLPKVPDPPPKLPDSSPKPPSSKVRTPPRTATELTDLDLDSILKDLGYCRWPGCENQIDRRKSYCLDHAEIVYVPTKRQLQNR